MPVTSESDPQRGEAAPRSPSAPPVPERTSAALRRFAGSWTAERISLGDIVAAVPQRAYGVLLIAFALPNLVPVSIPGMSTVLSVPILILAAQLAWGRGAPWLPRWLAGRSLAYRDFMAVLDRAVPILERIERFLKPRWSPLIGPHAARALGGVVLILGAILSLPIPLGNWLPAFAIVLMSLALTERDGAVAAVGLAVACVSMAVVALVLLGGAAAAAWFLQWIGW